MKKVMTDLLVRVCAKTIVEEAYLGVLARNVDPVGLASYSSALKSRLGLAGLLGELSNSNEHWENCFSSHFADLLASIYQGLLEREPQRFEIEKYGSGLGDPSGLVSPGALAPVLADVAGSDERWNKTLEHRADGIVRTVFHRLLGREPEAAVIQHYAGQVKATHDLGGLLAAIAGSDEYWQTSLRAHASELVGAFYRDLLGQEPDSDFMSTQALVLAELGDPEKAFSQLARSDAFWQKIFSERAHELAKSVEQGIFEGPANADRVEHHAALLRTGPDGLIRALLLAINSEAHREQWLRRHADELVQTAFTSLLGREAEPEALRAYSNRIRSTHALGNVLTDIVHSDEAWQRQLGNHADVLITMIYEVVLRRRPDPAETERLRFECRSLSDFASLLEDLLEGEEFQARQFIGTQQDHELSMKLVDALYRGLLNRPAEKKAQQLYAANIKSADDLASLASILCKSLEFNDVHRKAQGGPPPSPGTWHPVVARIEALYMRYLKRPATRLELAQHLMQERPVWEIEQQLIFNRLERPGTLRVLIFGAYGNGNIGDAYQALAVRAHLMANFSDRPIEVFACSLLCSSEYAYPAAYKLSPKAILDIELVNSFDYLIVGGGGLLAHPHDPLADKAWSQHIYTPIILLAVGATLAEVARHQPLLSQALHVFGRDASSVAALASVRPDVRLAADPILSLGGIDGLLSSEISSREPVIHYDVLWILKYPAGEQDYALLREIGEYMRQTSEKKHLIVGIEPAMDGVMAEEFEGMPVVLTESLDGLADLIKQSARVFSMRYHGAIFALSLGRQVIGASQAKLRDLAERFGAPAAYLENASELRPDMWVRAMTATHEQLGSLNAEFTQTLSGLGR
ncbi:MAG: polysaccharide pyruvyl transferase family protein [Burkholderiales bacterium]